MRLLQFAVNCSRINRARSNVTQLRQAGRVSAWSAFVAIATLFVVVGSVRNAAAQSTGGRPYPNYNWNSYYGPLYYNPGYAQYGLPGVGVSPWNPIVQAQLDLGLRTARYNLYSAWADEANAAANLRYQQTVGQSIQNRKQAMRAQHDLRRRVPEPIPSAPEAPRVLPPNDVLENDGTVVWPASAPSSRSLDRSRSAAEEAIQIAVNEYIRYGRATFERVVEAKNRLAAYGMPALAQLKRSNPDEAEKLLDFLKRAEQVLNQLTVEA